MSDVVSSYFDAIAQRDIEAMAAMWAPDGEEHIASQVDTVGPGGVREYFTEVFAAFPDLVTEVRSMVSEGDRTAVHWVATGTHLGVLWGIAGTGARVTFEGIDMIEVRDGKIVRNDAVPDGMAVARQIGVLPDGGSPTERRLFSAFNAKTRVERRAAAGRDLERVGAGVWLLRGGTPRTMNVYFLEDPGGGVTLFDAGIKAMTRAVAEAAASLGPINRIVLGHADADHRGAASGLGVPVFCHPLEVEAAGSDAFLRDYHRLELLGFPARHVYRHLLRFWDGGPVPIAGTVDEGDDVSGFRVVHVPGHAPGLIALFRESDRLALTSDAFYVVDAETGRKMAPALPPDAFNQDTAQARESLRKLAALDPAAAWPGHGNALVSDVRAALERAAAG
jgi:glyoxylase-like metal-dependent hydrolase (beta-lactamase superfamily II)/predicted ester cyclase